LLYGGVINSPIDYYVNVGFLAYEDVVTDMFTIIETSPTVTIVSGANVLGLEAYNSSIVNVNGGSIGSLEAIDHSMLNMSGGNISGGLYLGDGADCTINVNGGSIGFLDANTFGFWTINMSGGSISNPLSVSGGTFNMSGGNISGGLYADENSVYNMSGGSIGGDLHAYDITSINVSGGSIGDLYAYENARLNFYGHDLVLLNPTPVSDVNGESQTGYGVRYTLSGFLSDGTDVTGKSIYIFDQATINLHVAFHAPTNLQVSPFVGSSGDRIYLSWDYGSDPIDGFKIERQAAGSTTWEQLPDLPDPSARATVDTVPNLYGTYSYRVRAYKGTDISDYSNTATCLQVSDIRVDDENGYGNKPVILGLFEPNRDISINQVALALGYDHFNWVSIVYQAPHPYYGLTPPFIDPPPGGYPYLPADNLPFYWDEPGERITHSIGPTLDFGDEPKDPTLTGDQHISFITCVAGVRADGTWDALTSFSWSSNFTGSVGGIIEWKSLVPSTTAGTGGVFNIQQNIPIPSLPVSIRQLFIQSGARNVTDATKTDTDAPMTTAFLSGSEGNTSWYTGPVNVTLIATDIDGPADIAATYYGVDGGTRQTYSGHFNISSDGIHTITYWSIDRAGNIEPINGPQIIKIDSTPPRITASANSSSLWPPNGKMIPVTISGQITDNLSGVDFSSAAFSVVDDYGLVQPSGAITVNSDGSYSIGFLLEAKRNGQDKQGRHYTVTIRAKDTAGNIGSASTVVTVPHDQGH
jgi:hypothetical protein